MRVSTFRGAEEPTDCAATANRTGATVTEYSAEWTTVTDPAGKQRRQRTDGLGRLVEVIEDPTGLNYSTTYGYDTLDNLTLVTQGGQTRSFAYSSLGRLLSADNPESGATTYEYYDSGDLKKKTDARGRITEITYDVQRRILSKNYNDGTPAVTYTYYLAGSSSAPNIGQAQSVSNGVATTSYSYNWLGQIESSSQAIAGLALQPFHYTWYLNGALASQIYPSGRTVNYEVDDAGRTSRVYSMTTSYANLTSAVVGDNAYTADGRIAKMRLGNGLYETRDYRPAGTATTYMLGVAVNNDSLTRLEYDLAPGANNGNVMG